MGRKDFLIGDGFSRSIDLAAYRLDPGHRTRVLRRTWALAGSYAGIMVRYRPYSDQTELGNRLAFLEQLCRGGINAAAGEVVDV